MKNNPNFSMIGDLSTGEMAELICRSKVLVCNDSGPMHVAVGVGTRVVAIYGSQDYTRSYPRGEKDVVLRKDKTLHMHVNTLNNFKYDNNPNISKTYQYFIKPKELYSITNFIYDRPDDIVPKWLSENIINYK